MKDKFGNELKFSVKALAYLRGATIEEMAIAAGIDASHLKQVSAGNATMTATDLFRLSEWSGIPSENIITDKPMAN